MFAHGRRIVLIPFLPLYMYRLGGKRQIILEGLMKFSRVLTTDVTSTAAGSIGPRTQ
jgi:hypothetical protein